MIQSREPSLDAIYRALEQVYDPELDDSILKLEFVDAVEVEGGQVTVRYKVPTFWCAPNFVFMMSHDIRREVLAVPGVERVTVLVRNNCVEQEVNAGVNAGQSFAETFANDVDSAGADLEELRLTFARKGFLARQDVLIRRLRQAGLADEEILALRGRDLIADQEDVLVQRPAPAPPLWVRLAAADLARYRHKRRALGLANDADAPVFTSLDDRPLSVAELPEYLRRSRTARLNIAFNTTLCEGLLRATYTPERIGDTSSVGDALLLAPRGS
jgi:metal-sulfur cluster biosynthetic enzyme